MKIKINISWIILFLMLLNVLLSVGIIEKKIDKLEHKMLIGLNVCGRTLDEIEKEMREYER
jgi:hypothetical protein